MKRILKLMALLFLICIVFIVSFSLSRYTLQKDGAFSFAVARPIVRVNMGDEIYISNYEQRPLLFSVYNFDTANNISEVAMNYKLKITVSQTDAPLDYKLYRVYSDNSEQEISISFNNGVITSMEDLSMQATNPETHNYKLECIYDKDSSIELNSNVRITIDVNAEQKRI